jgi:hypothetical protein
MPAIKLNQETRASKEAFANYHGVTEYSGKYSAEKKADDGLEHLVDIREFMFHILQESASSRNQGLLAV